MWERQTPVKLLSLLQAPILPGMNHSFQSEPQSWAVSRPGPGRAAKELWETLGWASSAKKTCHISLPVGLCRWQINEGGLRGLSLMRLWKWKGFRWKNKNFWQPEFPTELIFPSLSFISSRNKEWEWGRCHRVWVTKGDKNPTSILRPLISFSSANYYFFVMITFNALSSLPN